MEVSTPFDAALDALLTAWKVRDDLRAQGNDDHARIRAAWLDLDDARRWARRARSNDVWRFQHHDDPRTWLGEQAARRVRETTQRLHGLGTGALADTVRRLAARNNAIHLRECVNLNPATNVMNPTAEALLSSGLGTRPSLGHPGEKYEMGLEAIEQIEVLAAALAREVFDAGFAEVRVPSGAMANLTAFMALARPGDAVIVPPPQVAGHVTHQQPGAAGLFGLEVHHAPIDPATYSLDVEGLATLTERVRPRLITLGASLNLDHHPVEEVRQVADTVGARVLFDAAHLCGLIAGGAWPNPLTQGAHVMTMSTYKSLAGPPGGLVLTDDADIAERVEAVAYPGLTANFDVAKTAALAITLLDWIDHGKAYAAEMVATAASLVALLDNLGIPRFHTGADRQRSHQFVLHAGSLGGGTAAARHLRQANLLASAIGLPGDGDGEASGLRMGTPELVRWGITGDALPQLASFIAQAWRADDPARLADKVARFRRDFRRLHHLNLGTDQPTA